MLILLTTNACSHRYITKEVKVPVLVKPRLPDALRALPQNPCKHQSCWVMPNNPLAKWAIQAQHEKLLRQYVSDLKNYGEACMLYFDDSGMHE